VALPVALDSGQIIRPSWTCPEGADRAGWPVRISQEADRKVGSGLGSGYEGRSREGYANDLRGV